jgi:hypothetical protein
MTFAAGFPALAQVDQNKVIHETEDLCAKELTALYQQDQNGMNLKKEMDSALQTLLL